MAVKKTFLAKDWDDFVKQGRGCARFENYRPAFVIREVCSNAQRQRIYINKFGRTFELMSHGETLTLLQLDWNDRVIEVREQFPLNPETTTRMLFFTLLAPDIVKLIVTIQTPTFKTTLEKKQPYPREYD